MLYIHARNIFQPKFHNYTTSNVLLTSTFRPPSVAFFRNSMFSGHWISFDTSNKYKSSITDDEATCLIRLEFDQWCYVFRCVSHKMALAKKRHIEQAKVRVREKLAAIEQQRDSIMQYVDCQLHQVSPGSRHYFCLAGRGHYFPERLKQYGVFKACSTWVFQIENVIICSVI